MKITRCLFLVAVVGLVACAAPSGDEVDETTAELTNGDPSADPAYVVEIHTPLNGGSLCTANVISQHYLLTSAHCFASSGAKAVTIHAGQTAETLAYDGTSDVIIHPNWVDGADDREAWDIAVVRLHDAGMGVNASRIRIYAGPETPWTTTKGTYFSVSGYGFGSNAGGDEDCTDAGLGTKRGGRFAFNGDGMRDGTTWFSVHGYSTIRSTCHGDSGAGYRLFRNNEDFLFALHSTSDHVAGGTIIATMVQTKLAWILARSSDTLGLPLACSLVRDHRSAQEVDYYNCAEHPRPVIVPIDPRPIQVLQP